MKTEPLTFRRPRGVDLVHRAYRKVRAGGEPTKAESRAVADTVVDLTRQVLRKCQALARENARLRARIERLERRARGR